MKRSARFRITAYILSAVLLLISAVSLTACGAGADYRDYDFFAMDTYIKLRLADETRDGVRLDDDYLDSVANGCADILSSIEGMISFHSEGSDIYALNSGVDAMIVNDEGLISLLEAADTVSDLTDGAYDYTLGTLTELWDPKNGAVPSYSAITDALAHTGRDKINIIGKTVRKLDADVKLDLGGIGKGAATQQILEYLAGTDVAYGLVSLGGSIGVYGEKTDGEAYKVGIIDPRDTDGVIGYMNVRSGFISVSGDYERFFEVDGVRYHHIIDPKTGYPAQSGVASVMVYTSNGSSADALSTALFVLGVERSMELYDAGELKFEAIFVTSDGELVMTPGITEEMFEPSEKYKN